MLPVSLATPKGIKALFLTLLFYNFSSGRREMPEQIEARLRAHKYSMMMNRNINTTTASPSTHSSESSDFDDQSDDDFLERDDEDEEEDDDVNSFFYYYTFTVLKSYGSQILVVLPHNLILV